MRPVMFIPPRDWTREVVGRFQNEKYHKAPPVFSYHYSFTSQYNGGSRRRRILCVCGGGGAANSKGGRTRMVKVEMPQRSKTERHNTREAELRNASNFAPPPLPTASWEILRGRAKVLDYGGSALRCCPPGGGLHVPHKVDHVGVDRTFFQHS